MVLITGAAGKTGQAVIRALGKHGVPIRALVYRGEQRQAVERAGARQTVVGDMQDYDIMRRVAKGVNAVYHICPNMSPYEVLCGNHVIEACKENGVRRLVYHSVLHPQIEAMPHHWWKMRVEELLLESGLDFTILQPAAYMQNILAGWTAIVESGTYRVPYSVETRLAMVDLLDVAAVAATVLSDPVHIGATYGLVGPGLLTQVEVAACLSSLLNRRVVAEQIPLSEWKANAATAGLGNYQVDTLEKMFTYYDQFGLVGNAWLLERLLGKSATTLTAFFERILDRQGD